MSHEIIVNGGNMTAEKLSKEIWKKITDLALSMLKEKGLHYECNLPALDGRYLKMKGKAGLFFTFAVNQVEVWVELEIKPIVGQPQDIFYNKIHSRASDIENELGYEIRWDDVDRKTPGKRSARRDFRIKSIMPFTPDDIRTGESNFVKSFAERMALFIMILTPLLPGTNQKKQRGKTVDAIISCEYLPTKDDVDSAEWHLRSTSPNEVIDPDAVLDLMESDFKNAGKPLKENWREITKLNIPMWFSK